MIFIVAVRLVIFQCKFGNFNFSAVSVFDPEAFQAQFNLSFRTLACDNYTLSLAASSEGCVEIFGGITHSLFELGLKESKGQTHNEKRVNCGNSPRV